MQTVQFKINWIVQFKINWIVFARTFSLLRIRMVALTSGKGPRTNFFQLLLAQYPQRNVMFQRVNFNEVRYIYTKF